MKSRLLRLATLFVAATLLNFPWEVAQMPLYGFQSSLLEFAVHCIVPSLGDGIIVLMIFGVGLMLLRRWSWADRPDIVGHLLMLSTGLAIAILIEWGAVYGLDRWRYSASMPQLPVLGIGVFPVL